MKKYVEFSNKGGFDVSLATIIGFTTKRDDDSKVGKFGSGLKYSIPYLLRNNVDFHLYVGEKPFKFDAEIVEGYHNNSVVKTEVVKVNGQSTGLSVDAGPDWIAWFTIREIVQNAYDEEDFQYNFVDEPSPKEGYVKWYLEFAHFRDILMSWDDYFSFDRTPIWEGEYNGIKAKFFTKNSNKESGSIYYQGFYVGSIEHLSFDVELSYVEINEYREVANAYLVKQHISNIYLTSVPKAQVKHSFANFNECVEWYQVKNIDKPSYGLAAWVKDNREFIFPDYKILNSHGAPDLTNYYVTTDVWRALIEWKLVEGNLSNGFVVEELDPLSDEYRKGAEKIAYVRQFFSKIGYDIPESIGFYKLIDAYNDSLVDNKSKLIALDSKLINRDNDLLLMEVILCNEMLAVDTTLQSSQRLRTELLKKVLKYMNEQYRLLEGLENQ